MYKAECFRGTENGKIPSHLKREILPWAESGIGEKDGLCTRESSVERQTVVSVIGQKSYKSEWNRDMSPLAMQGVFSFFRFLFTERLIL